MHTRFLWIVAAALSALSMCSWGKGGKIMLLANKIQEFWC